MEPVKPPYETLMPLGTLMTTADIRPDDIQTAKTDWVSRFKDSEYEQILEAIEDE